MPNECGELVRPADAIGIKQCALEGVHLESMLFEVGEWSSDGLRPSRRPFYHGVCVREAARSMAPARKKETLGLARPARLIELSLAVVDLPTQSLVLSPQDFPLALRTLQTLAEHGRVRRLAVVVSRDSRLRHTPVMPESRLLYKRR